MTPERWKQIKALLEEALPLGREERALMLERVGGADPALRDEVRDYLRGEDDPTPLTAAAATAVVAEAATSAEVGARVGPYRLEAEVGRGGMGTVYRACRADGQYEARVAIKLVRADIDREQAAARFRLERQYLAALEHPFIARLLDGGVFEDGRLYLVLEYVDGVPIDAYCASRALALDDRLRLFRKVCAAVEYAHQRLIVHRDLKPSNVLICADGTPKLVDFGIAKLLGPQASAAATQDAGRFLTPGYASPEQRAGAAISTASDVYSLGVLLHEILTASLPRLPPGDGPGADPLPASAVALGAGPPALDPRPLRGDLDAIVAKALRNAPEERYPTPAALDEDLGRFLEGAPVRARRSTLAYRVRKFARRHRIGLSMASALCLSLMTGGVLYAVEVRATARAQQIAARRGRFLEKVLQSADPAGGRRDVTVAEILDGASAQLWREPREDPLVAASLFGVLAETDVHLGRYPQAVEECERALLLLREHKGDNDSVADALMTRGEALTNLGKLSEAEASLRQAVDLLSGSSRPSQARAQAQHLLGIALKTAGKEQEAEGAYRASIALYRALGSAGEDRLAYPVSDLGILMGEQGHYAEASALTAEAVSVIHKYLPADHPDVLSFELARAGALMGLHRDAEAERLIRGVVEGRRRVLGAEHKDTLQAAVELVDCLTDQGRHAEAVAVGRPTAEALERVVGFEHPVALYAWAAYAYSACESDDAAEGLSVLRRVEAVRRRLYGAQDWHPASTRLGMGTCLAALGRLPEAESTLLEAAGALERARGPGFHRTQAAYAALRDLCARMGRDADAARWAARMVPPR